MADQSDKNTDGLGAEPDADREELEGDAREENNEWLRDQVGEDHNLSGSSTFRTLPDQPDQGHGDQSRDDQDRGDRDTEQRQSNR
jgi:hypothetical protein